jgi:hypothetical protein
MDVTTFCVDLRQELTGFKAKAYDLLRAMDKRSSSGSEKAAASMDDLGRMIDQIEGKITQLEDRCPTDWGTERTELEAMVAELEEKWGEAAMMSPDDFE